MAERISLNCSILGDIRAFVVDVALSESTTVYHLMRAIKAEALNHVHVDLVLWKFTHSVVQFMNVHDHLYPEQPICHYCAVTRLQLSDPISSGDITNKLGKIVDGADIPGAERLEPLKNLSSYFAGFAEPVQDSICLVVQVLSPGLSGYKRDFDQTLESAPEPFKRRKLKLLSNSRTIYQTDPGPVTASRPPPANHLPSGGAGFADLTTYPNIIAADKTRYIELLDAAPKYQYLFLRPRRFGKSTFLQTLSSYYDKRLQSKFDDIFGCLYIGKNPTEAASSLLVLCFDFSQITVTTSLEEAKESFHRVINNDLRDFLMNNQRCLLPFDADVLLDRASGDTSLRNVLNLVKNSGHKLFVGVDEYDAPVNAVLARRTNTLYQDLTAFFTSSFFGVLKSAVSQDIVVKYWLTGVLPAFRNGISPLSATRILSKTPQFHGLCGFTDAEVRTIAESYLPSTSKSYDIEAVMHELQQWHNGYRFCQAPMGEVIEPLYNPQLVCAHLESLVKGHSTRPDDELEALHTTNVLNSIDKSTFREIFLLAASAKLDSTTVKHQFSAEEFRGAEENSWLTHTLLFFFGIFTFAESGKFLKIPNKTVQTLITERLSHLIDESTTPSSSLVK